MVRPRLRGFTFDSLSCSLTGTGSPAAVTVMEASHPFSDSDITSAGIYYADPPPSPPVSPAEVAGLSRLSKHLAFLLGAPELDFCSDASIFVRSVGEEDPRPVRVHRCILAARSSFFRDKFAEGAKELELEKLVGDFEVGLQALQTVIQYVYTGRLEELPVDAAECVDESYCRHEACWPAVHFMLQALHAASTFDINELVSVFQRRLLDIIEKVATDDILSVLFVANLSKRFCQRLVDKCIEIVVESDINYITLKKKLPPDVVSQIKQRRADFGQRQNGIPDKHETSIFGALDLDDIELVKMLLDEGNTNLDDAKALHYAVSHCDLKITKELLDLNRADVNGRDHRNYTVLHYAAMRKEPEIIMSLLTKGAQPFETTPDGRKALQIAKRLTRRMDYHGSTEQGKPSPKEFLCIEMLERAELRDSSTEVTSVPAEMKSDNLFEKLWYLEIRVRLAERLYPTEAKAAMKIANVEGTPMLMSNFNLYAGNKRFAEDVVKTSFTMTKEHLSRMEALSKTVQLGMQFFPRCSRVIDKILDVDLSKLSIIEHIDTEERKKRYNEILADVNDAFTQDIHAIERAGSSSASTSKSARSTRTKKPKR